MFYGNLTQLSGSISGLFFDKVNNEIYVTNSSPKTITVYGRTTIGNAAPVRTISGSLTGLNSPCGISVDTVNNEIFVTGANTSDPKINVFARTASGNAAPLRTIIGAATGLYGPVAVAVDTVSNEIIEADMGNNSIIVYARTANGNAAPIRTIHGLATGLQYSFAIAIVHSDPAPTNSTITVSGSVVDMKTGAKVSNVRVDAYSLSSSETYSTLSDALGSYSILAPANREIYFGFSAAGFAPRLTKIMTLSANTTYTLYIFDETTVLAEIKALGQCTSAIAFNDPCISGKSWIELSTIKVADGTDAPGVTVSASPTGPLFAYNNGAGIFSALATVVRTSNTYIPMIGGYNATEGTYTLTLTDGVTTANQKYILKYGVLSGSQQLVLF